MSVETMAALMKKQDRQAMLWIAVPGNAHELEVCKRKGVGIDFSEPEGHAGPKSQVRGVAALVSM